MQQSRTTKQRIFYVSDLWPQGSRLRPQEDVVMGTLTVRENLRFSAALRLPCSVPQSEKEARVNHLIKELGLTKVADSKVKK